jgi:hypothetical protein
VVAAGQLLRRRRLLAAGPLAASSFSPDGLLLMELASQADAGE